MSDVFSLPQNFIGKHDRERLESFGGHTIAHGRATRFHWDKNAEGDDVFQLFLGGAREILAVTISRNREADAFQALDKNQHPLVSGSLDHVLAEVENVFKQLHGEMPDTE